MKISEVPIEEIILQNIPGAAKEGAQLISISTDAAPLEIIKAVNAFVAKPVKRGWFRKTDNWNDRAMPLGALWGTQMVREFRWEWVNLVQHEHNDLKLVGVFDKRRSIGVYPFHFVYGCIENGVYPTIELAFNMLSAGKVPLFEDNAYENLMDGVRHIIPPA